MPPAKAGKRYELAGVMGNMRKYTAQWTGENKLNNLRDKGVGSQTEISQTSEAEAYSEWRLLDGERNSIIPFSEGDDSTGTRRAFGVLGFTYLSVELVRLICSYNATGVKYLNVRLKHAIPLLLRKTKK